VSDASVYIAYDLVCVCTVEMTLCSWSSCCCCSWENRMWIFGRVLISCH